MISSSGSPLSTPSIMVRLWQVAIAVIKCPRGTRFMLDNSVSNLQREVTMKDSLYVSPLGHQILFTHYKYLLVNMKFEVKTDQDWFCSNVRTKIVITRS